MKGIPQPKVHPELKSLLPQPNGNELARLYASIAKYGPIIPILVTEAGWIVEGYHRFEYYLKEKIKKYPIAVIPGLDTVEKMKNWMVDHQLARRNFTDSARLEWIGKKYEEIKKPAGYQGAKEPDTVSGYSADALAAEHGVSPRTVERAAEFARAVEAQPKELHDAIVAGQVPVKTVIAAAQAGSPLFCKRCTQTKMPRHGCENCAELRGKIKKPKKPKQAEKGSVLIDWKGIDSTFGKMVKLTDSIRKHYSKVISADEVKEYDRMIGRLTDLWQGWQKKLTGGGK